MNAIKNLSLLLLITLLSINISAQKKKSDWINGIWRGTGFQLNNSSSWSIMFEANTNANVYKINYGSLSCGGKWELQKIEENRAVFIEKITVGKDKCINGNTIIVTYVNNNYVSYTCFAPGSTKLDASATLEKAEK